MSAAQTRAQREREMNARLLNWGKWAAMSHEVSSRDDHALEVNELDAQVVEEALCRMKRMRDDLWAYVDRCYLRRWMVETIAQDLRVSVSSVYAKRQQVLVWLDGYWENQRRHG